MSSFASWHAAILELRTILSEQIRGYISTETLKQHISGVPIEMMPNMIKFTPDNDRTTDIHIMNKFLLENFPQDFIIKL